MQNSTKENLEYSKNLIRIVANERRLQLSFLPPELQKKAIAYYGLDAELKHVHQHVSEEMIGHIRYAWWREELDKLGEAHQKHPVLALLAESGLPVTQLIALVDSYRDVWPQLPAHPPELAIGHARYNKAGEVIAKHRGGKLSLIFKLLFV